MPDFDAAAPIRDPGEVETDAHAQSSAEELDEDRLRLDPLEAGMDPPERWSGVDKYGMTPYEQAHPRGIDERLAEEEPDVLAEADPVDVAAEPRSAEPLSEQADELDETPVASGLLGDDAGLDDEVMRESIDRGQLADDAGGSVASVTRIPDEAPIDDPAADDLDLPLQ
ncbi:MAG TPA: hypothetical protein VGE11_04790 [Pseudonocardia sp.]